MGNPKQKWTPEEEEALKAGVKKHGTGKWKNILKDPEFAPFLTNRSNIDLKDKWRNVSISTGQISKVKSMAPRIKQSTAIALPVTPISAVPISVVEDDAVDDPSKSPQEGRNATLYDSMIFEAITDIKDPNGSDIGAIVHFIEQQHEVPQNFRRLLSSNLRRLVLKGKLEKVQNCFKMKDAASGAKTPMPKKKDVCSRPSQNFGSVTSIEKLKDAAINAAYRIAEAENKSFVAAEAVREYERAVNVAEDTDSALLLVKDIYDRCSQGQMVLLSCR
ncbi:telomere repeat-binding factor 4-like [Coffea arabica]|uniref:MYB transcription factor n=1 Tax=Coffea arabica TaxID=13443 RepID=A0ABM4U239_COFAR